MTPCYAVITRGQDCVHRYLTPSGTFSPDAKDAKTFLNIKSVNRAATKHNARAVLAWTTEEDDVPELATRAMAVLERS